MALSPTSSRGGGGSTPFNGGEITTLLDIDVASGDALSVDSGDAINGGMTWLQDDSSATLRGIGGNSGQLAVRDDVGGSTITLKSGTGVLAAALYALTGPVVIGLNVVPADGDISAGQVALWFDATNGVGATKLMAKGKSADGTVKTASIVLT